MTNKTIGCIGIGVMGTALMESIIKTTNPNNIFIFDIDKTKLKDFCSRNSCNPTKSNAEVAKVCDYIILAVKPQFIKPILQEISTVLTSEKTIISMLAGTKIEAISSTLNHKNVIRIMPNTPVSVESGVIALANTNLLDKTIINDIKSFLSKAGIVEVIDENLMDAVTAVSGSGPAYGYVFIDALADAAVKMGMNRKQAISFAAKTLEGAAKMVLETGKNPSQLKDEVCSPAGTTIAGLAVLEEKGFRNAIIQGALAAWQRSKELSK